jgi:PTS system glucose-specific IIA component
MRIERFHSPEHEISAIEGMYQLNLHRRNSNMLGLFKKIYSLVAPVTGRTVDLSDVPDDVFAKRLAGDGVAIESTGNTIVAPADGVLTLVFRTNHAFGVTLDNGLEVLVHIGIDTVELEGKGFERLAEQGTRVKAGDPVVRVDRDAILSSGRSLITPVLITNINLIDNLNPIVDANVTSGIDRIITYSLK